jgi:hypothetical protein
MSIKPDFVLTRVESRWNPDGVDFWDFIVPEEADSFILQAHPSLGTLTVRTVEGDELIQVALQYLKDSL